VAEFRLLGPVEVWSAGRQLDPGQPRQRTMLAALLVDAGRPVTIETLVNRIWGDVPPDGARHALHTYVTRIRRLLDQLDTPIQLVRRSGAYVLEVDRDQVDLHRFRGLIQRARDPRCPDPDRIALLRDALALWRGEPLAGLSGQWPAQIRERDRGQRLDAVVLWAQAELRVGDPGQVIAPVTDLIGEYPLVEPLTGVLMRALHAAGRTGEALDCYTGLRKRLVQELGTEPGADLQGVHQAILRGDAGGTGTPGGPAAAVAPTRAGPAQLPLGVRGFAGRGGELARLDAVLAEAGTHPTAVVISAVSGTAGVGKTALAVHWAHRVADRFPDGQLYVNLRGFDPTGSAMPPAEAVRGFLDALEVPAQRIPASLEAQTSLYRSRLARRRMLIVLDNARDADQVRPLLPGSPGCLVVVTSRNQLPGLVAVEGAHPVTLDLLPRAEARELLVRRLGADRVAAEPQAVDEVVARCAGLPLALAIVAGRAATHPTFTLATLAGELREARGGLDAFDGADAATDVRAVFSWSYRTLRPETARLFRLLGLHPGADVAAPAAACLADVPAGRARFLLAELTRAHLVTEHSPGRFTLHDLLRAYAAELTRTLDSDADRRAAVTGMLDCYLGTVAAAMDALYPQERHRRPRVAPPTSLPFEADPRAARAWLDSERANLAAATGYAAGHGWPRHAGQLAATLSRYLYTGAHYKEAQQIHDDALRAARADGDRRAEGTALVNLGHTLMAVGRAGQAQREFERALAIFRDLNDRARLALALYQLGIVHRVHSRYPLAYENLRQALAIFGELGDRLGESNALGALSEAHAEAGSYPEARDQLQRALAISREIGDRMGEGNALGSLGEVYRRLGRHGEACDNFARALTIFRELGYPRAEARTLNGLGESLRLAGRTEDAVGHHRSALAVARAVRDPYEEASALNYLALLRRAAGDREQARVFWTEALSIYAELAIPDGDEVRRHLAALDS